MKLVDPVSKLRTESAGQAYLKVEVVDGLSSVTSHWGRSPLRLLVPRSRGSCVWASMSSLGGGLVAGDRYALEVEVGQGANCYLGTQASTKVYRNPLALPCGQELYGRIGPGAQLIVAPDPVQAFKESCYTQKQEFHLHPDSGLIVIDWVCAGRTECGERWAFSRYQSRNEVFLGTRRVFIDSIELDQTESPPGALYRAGRFNCLALVLVLGSPFASLATSLLHDLETRPVERGKSLICCGSPVRMGALIRIAGEKVEQVSQEVRRQLGSFEGVLGEDPWSRKW